MKRVLVPGLFAVISLQIPLIANAEGAEPIGVANLFSWLTKNPPDWGLGIMLALLGLVGALVTIFGLVGGAVPGTAGQASIDADTERLRIMSDKLLKLVENPSANPESIKAVEQTVNDLRDDLRAEKWRQFSIAAALYTVLGAFFATLLAQDILQALVIGSGWTTVIGTLGLKRDYAERKETKDNTLKETLDALETATSKLKEIEASLKSQTTKSIEDLGFRPSYFVATRPISDIQQNVRIAMSV